MDDHLLSLFAEKKWDEAKAYLVTKLVGDSPVLQNETAEQKVANFLLTLELSNDMNKEYVEQTSAILEAVQAIDLALAEEENEDQLEAARIALEKVE